MGKFNFNQNEFDEVKNSAEKLYKELESVYCPYFKEKFRLMQKDCVI